MYSGICHIDVETRPLLKQHAAVEPRAKQRGILELEKSFQPNTSRGTHMAKKSRNQNSSDKRKDELSLDQLDTVSGGGFIPQGTTTNNNDAQMLTDLHLTQPNALQPHNQTNPGIQTDILTGTHAGGEVIHTATTFTATADSRAGVANTTELSVGTLHSQAGADVDTSFKAGPTGVSGQVGAHVIASTSLDMGAGFTNNNTVRGDAGLYGSAGIFGVSGGAEAGARASTNITQSNNVDVGAGTHVFNSTVYEAGGKAEAGAHAHFNPLQENMTVGVNTFAGGYVSLGETVGVESHGVTSIVGGSVITPGSVGVGFTPLIGAQDGKYNFGLHGALAAGIGGVTLDFNVSLDQKMVDDFATEKVGGTAMVGYSKSAEGLTTAYDATAHVATDTAHTVATGATNTYNTVATGITNTTNDLVHGATGVVNTIGSGITNTANNAIHGVTDGLNAGLHGVTSGLSNAVGGAVSGISNAINSAADHAISSATQSVTNAIGNVMHGGIGALSPNVSGVVNDLSHAVTDAAHNAMSAAADAARHQAEAAAHAAADAAAQAKAAAEHAAAEAAAQAKHAAEQAAAQAKAAAEHAVAEARAAAERIAHEAAAAKAAAEKHAAELAAAAKAAAERAAAEAKAAAEAVAREAARVAAEIKAAAEREAARLAAEAKAAAEAAAREAARIAEETRRGLEAAARETARIAEEGRRAIERAAADAKRALEETFCHVAGTPIAMADGTYKPVEQLKIGDEVLLGGQVLGRGEVMASDLYSYRGTVLNGRHAVFEDGRWVRVEQSAYAMQLDAPPTTVYPVVTANHLLVCEQYICADLAEMDEDIGAVGRLAAMNADTRRNLDLRRAEEAYGFAQQRAA
jgi:hypothetical protein